MPVIYDYDVGVVRPCSQMNIEAAPLEPRFAAYSPAPVDGVGTVTVEPPPLLPSPDCSHAPMSGKAAPLDPSFAPYSPDTMEEVSIAPVEPPPVLPRPKRPEVSSAGDSGVRPRLQMSDEYAPLETPLLRPSSASHDIFSVGGSVVMERVA